MTELVLLIILVTAISSDTFSGVFLNGFVKLSKTAIVLRMAAVISVVHALMATVGMLLGGQFNLLLVNYAGAFTAIILLMVGLKILIKSFKPKFQELLYELDRMSVLVGFSFALGVNSLLTGLAISAFHFTYKTVLIVFFIINFLMVIMGAGLGKKSKNFLLAARLGLAGGVIVTLGALILMLNLLNLV
jgi:putative Mn2+ efflux pump MntP